MSRTLRTRIRAGNPKSESRNPKQIQNPNPKAQNGSLRTWDIRILLIRIWISLVRQHLLEDHKVVPAIGVPADADDIVAQGDGQVQHRAVLIVAFETDRLVFVLLGPAMHGVHQLRGDSLASAVGHNAVE